MKKFWRIFKKVMIVASAATGAVLFVIVLTSAVKRQNELKCSGIKVHIDYDSGISFLNEGEIAQRIHFLNEGNTVGMHLSSIDFHRLEKDVNLNPYIEHAELWVDQSQKIVVRITQKRPILRVINSDGVSYYISERNERIPLSDKFTAHVPVALGSVEMRTDPKRDSIVQSALWSLVSYVRKDEFLNALIDQIEVKENDELELVPKIEGHMIRFGLVDDEMQEKFGRLKTFYKEGFARAGWDKYKTVDLRFRDQVVCEKNDSINATTNNPSIL